MKLTAFIFAVGVSVSCLGAEQTTVRDRAYTFLEKNVIGRSQKTTLDGTLNSDGVEYAVHFEATVKWDKLKKTEEGLEFDETRDIKQTSTQLDKAGKPVGTPINTDRVVVHHHALAERATVKALMGVTNVTANSLEDPTGKAFVTMAELSPDDKELYLYQSMAGFSEASLDGKNMIPVATASEATLFLDKNGKLHTNETVKFYKVDVNKDFAREELNRFNFSASEISR